MSVPQDKQTFAIDFNVINERNLAIRVVPDAECHMITTDPMVLSPSLSCCRIVGDRLPCSDARSQAVVVGRNQLFFRMLEGAHNLH